MNISSSILKTLAYADIFDYPLTVCEVTNYLISNTKTSGEVVSKQLKILTDPSASSGQVYTDGELHEEPPINSKLFQQ